MTSKSSKSNNSLEGYVVKILENINTFEKDVEMKNGLGKIRNQSDIARSIGTFTKSNPTFIKSLTYCCRKRMVS